MNKSWKMYQTIKAAQTAVNDNNTPSNMEALNNAINAYNNMRFEFCYESYMNESGRICLKTYSMLDRLYAKNIRVF